MASTINKTKEVVVDEKNNQVVEKETAAVSESEGTAAVSSDLVTIPKVKMFGAIAVVEGSSEMEEFAGEGLENVTARDLLIPRIGIIQKLSPQMTRNKPDYIEEAKEGALYNFGLKRFLPNPLIVVPCHYQRTWLEWMPRASGGGLVNIHPDESIMAKTVQNDLKQNILPSKNIIVETMNFYVLYFDTDGIQRGFIPFSSTQLKKGRFWLTLATNERLLKADGSYFVPPLFYRSYQMTNVSESNAKGSWEGWEVERFNALPEFEGYRNLLTEAKQFRQGLTSGSLVADVASMAEEARAYVDGEVERKEGDGDRM